MKSVRPSRSFFLIATLCASALTLGAEIPEQDMGCFTRPAEDVASSFGGGKAKGVVAEIAGTASFQKWKTFEDDKVRFSYPDHEAITVEVKRDEPVPVDGDRVSSVDTSFSRAYRITAGGETLLVMMLNQAEWLDDGICLCGEVVYDRYLVRNSNLYRFSFLANGVLKKMQVLGDKEKIMMFEWTHLPLNPAVYRQIARSVELKKKGPWALEDCRKRVFERYGPEAMVGWFDEGSSFESVEKALGKPVRTMSDGIHVWEFPRTDDGYRWTERLSLPFADGKLVRFGSAYYDSAWGNREAIKGGIAWMKERAEPFKDESEKMPEELKEELLSLFLEKWQEKNQDFDSLCQVLVVLVEQGVQDEKALNMVRKHFASEGGHHAAWVLHRAGHAEDVTLFVQKVREIYNDPRGEKRGQAFDSVDLHNLLAFIPDDDKRYPELLREGLRSSEARVRESAYYFLDSVPFPDEERKAFVRNGLDDSSAEVRYWTTGCYDKKNATYLDWDLLRKAAAQEKDERTLKKMKEVLTKHDAVKARAGQDGIKDEEGGGKPAAHPELKPDGSQKPDPESNRHQH
jgi:hypothetical protein